MIAFCMVMGLLVIDVAVIFICSRHRHAIERADTEPFIELSTDERASYWMEITAIGDAQRTFIDRWSGERRYKPFEEIEL